MLAKKEFGRINFNVSMDMTFEFFSYTKGTELQRHSLVNYNYESMVRVTNYRHSSGTSARRVLSFVTSGGNCVPSVPLISLHVPSSVQYGSRLSKKKLNIYNESKYLTSYYRKKRELLCNRLDHPDLNQ